MADWGRISIEKKSTSQPWPVIQHKGRWTQVCNNVDNLTFLNKMTVNEQRNLLVVG